jgi:large subunit ribosomal protein L15
MELERFGKDTINLTEIGYDKLLGEGRASRKYNVTVESATEKAIQKIKSAGGTVTVAGKAEG